MEPSKEIPFGLSKIYILPETILFHLGEEEYKYGVKSTDYVDLAPFENDNMEDVYFEDVIRYSLSDDWKEQFFAIDLLRRLNKFASEILEDKLTEVIQFIEHSIQSPRTFLGKNSLIFIQELYMHLRSKKLLEFTWCILPTIITKTGHESYFISWESQIALQFIAASMPYPQVISLIWEGWDSKNLKVKSYSWQAVTIWIQNMDPSYFDDAIRFIALFDALNKGLITSKSAEEKESKKILKFIGKERTIKMWSLIYGDESEQQIKRILDVFKVQKNKTKATSGGFRKFLKQQKLNKDSDSKETVSQLDSTNTPIIIN